MCREDKQKTRQAEITSKSKPSRVLNKIKTQHTSLWLPIPYFEKRTIQYDRTYFRCT